ncbi:MAG: N-acetylmuramoyl-L-alanine amidase [Defluviitaleaceae bacterium]|nr:N-acetylmuramoyl-L-alanine amidase [Defluviitaleaceae bacterium]
MMNERVVEPLCHPPWCVDAYALSDASLEGLPFPGTNMRRGMNGPSIRQVQAQLNARGANPRLNPDGVFGPLTEAAVMAFQRANGLNPDGVVGPLTWGALFGAVSPPAPPATCIPYPGVVMRRGMQGPSIRQAQERLNALGANPRLSPDGIFGPLTEAAVMAFQRTSGLNADGVIGPLTWGRLFPCNAVTPPTPPPVTPPAQRFTIVLDAGHGGHDPGATMGTRRESNDNLRMAQAVQQILQARGQNVIMTRNSDVFITLGERSNIANRNNADLFLSIHRNGSTNPAANGVDIFIATGAPATTVQYAFNVLNRVVDAGVQNNRGVKRENFSVLRNTNAPAALLEMSFITNAEDNRLFDLRFNAYAQAIANGIMATLENPTPTGTYYTTVPGDSLWRIAQQFDTTESALMALNRLTTANVVIGQVLRVR